MFHYIMLSRNPHAERILRDRIIVNIFLLRNRIFVGITKKEGA